jgi:hypothetical protein
MGDSVHKLSSNNQVYFEFFFSPLGLLGEVENLQTHCAAMHFVICLF